MIEVESGSHFTFGVRPAATAKLENSQQHQQRDLAKDAVGTSGSIAQGKSPKPNSNPIVSKANSEKEQEFGKDNEQQILSHFRGREEGNDQYHKNFPKISSNF